MAILRPLLRKLNLVKQRMTSHDLSAADLAKFNGFENRNFAAREANKARSHGILRQFALDRGLPDGSGVVLYYGEGRIEITEP